MCQFKMAPHRKHAIDYYYLKMHFLLGVMARDLLCDSYYSTRIRTYMDREAVGNTTTHTNAGRKKTTLPPLPVVTSIIIILNRTHRSWLQGPTRANRSTRNPLCWWEAIVPATKRRAQDSWLLSSPAYTRTERG